jgi:hypothetical protein
MPKLDELYLQLAGLFEPSVVSHLGKPEKRFRSADKVTSEHLLESANLDFEVLRSAVAFKRAAGQIHEIVHAVGILLAFPHILVPNEQAEGMLIRCGLHYTAIIKWTATPKRLLVRFSTRTTSAKYSQFVGSFTNVKGNVRNKRMPL